MQTILPGVFPFSQLGKEQNVAYTEPFDIIY